MPRFPGFHSLEGADTAELTDGLSGEGSGGLHCRTTQRVGYSGPFGISVLRERVCSDVVKNKVSEVRLRFSKPTYSVTLGR